MISKLCIVALLLFAYTMAFVAGYHFALYRCKKGGKSNAGTNDKL